MKEHKLTNNNLNYVHISFIYFLFIFCSSAFYQLGCLLLLHHTNKIRFHLYQKKRNIRRSKKERK